MSGGGNRLGKTPHKPPLSSSSLITPSNKSQNHSMATPGISNANTNKTNNQTSDPNNNRSSSTRQLYTPAHFTLAKNADLHMENRPDAFSPATIRMTDSLEKILTDDDDYLEAKRRSKQQVQAQLQRAQARQLQVQVESPHRKAAPDVGNVAAPVGFESFPKAPEGIAAGRGAFRRIRSGGSSEDEEVAEEVRDLDAEGGSSTDEEEEEAEISQINDDEDDGDEDGGIDGADASLGRPKPLNFESAAGGAFEPAKALKGVVAVPAVGAKEGPVATSAKPGSLHTPKPQRTRPRPARPYHAAQGGGAGGQHPNQGQGGMYYPPHQQGYYGHQEGMMGGHPQHAASNMMFPHEQHQAPPHLQYPHPQHHHPQPPPHQYSPHHHPSQNYHHPSVPSPRFGPIPTGGVVSPLTIPVDYSGAYHPYSPRNSANAGGSSYPPQSHHSMHAIPTDYGGANPVGLPPGVGAGGGDWSWRGDHANNMIPQHHFGIHHHPHDHLQHQGMGIPTMPGHASPDFSFHELSGAVSPFNMPHPQHSFPPMSPAQHHANTYSRQHHHHSNHPHGTAPGMYHPGTPRAGAASPAAVASRHRAQSKENHGQTNIGHVRRPTSPYLPPSPGKHAQGSFSPGGRGGARPPQRGDARSVDGGGEEPRGGARPPSTFGPAALSSPSAGSSASVLRQAPPGLVQSASSEDQGPESGDWFHLPHGSQSSLSYPVSMEGRAYPKPRKATASAQEGYSPQQVGKGRGKKGNHPESASGAAVLAMQNVSGLGSGNSNSRGKKGPGKYQQQQPRERGKPQHRHPSPHGISRGVSIESDDAKHPPQPRGPGAPGEPPVAESPAERQAFKEFGRQFRQHEARSLRAARDYALRRLDPASEPRLPPATRWRVYLELADVAKRSNAIGEARGHYREACRLQPRASQGWLEHSKLEEECGNLERCAAILQEGLTHCTTNENLLVRAVKFYERMGDLDQARHLLSRTKHLSIDKSWKTVLEGALLEARVGRYSMAREVLKYLTHYVPWYGPLYLAHTKLERDYGECSEALCIVEKGLKELPRYGPLYFQAFRLLEKEDLAQKAFDLPRTMEMVSRADSISRELLWKVHLEAAQMLERSAALAVQDNPKKLHLRAALQPTRRSYAKAIMLCPPNLSWKIFLASGRTEVSCGNTRGARDLFLRAHDSVSEKGRSTVLLECARLEEFCGDLALSRSILCKARQQFGKSDWKVWLSSVNLECRCGLRERAIAFAQEALNRHRGTGRLWAALIQLRHDDGELYQTKVLKCALQAVPKSGEVWCEGARIHLNPFSPTFDLQAASRHLSFAARFTPQYGDSFLEQLRLNMIDQWLIPLATPFINSMYEDFLSSCSNNNKMQIEDAHKFIAENVDKAADVMKTQLQEKRDPVIKKDVLDTSELELRCSSADPNYGHLWFQCRNSPIDTAREVITQAKIVMADFVVDYAHLYIAAMVRRAGVLMIIHHWADNIIAAPTSVEGSQKAELPSIQGFPNSCHRDAIVDKQLRLAPPLDQMLLSPDDVAGSTFTTGCGGNSHNWEGSTASEKQKILFGSDSLLS